MKFVHAAIVTMFVFSASIAIAGGNKHKGESTSDIPGISVKQAAQLASTGKAIMVDANGSSTRKTQGVVPGARLLSSFQSFSSKELKAQKSDLLVFYCYNEHCGAAPAAATEAKKQGYKNVKVMHAGIIGWKKAGNPVAKI